MDSSTTDRAFRAMVARYEASGWQVTSLDTEHSRAIVRVVTGGRDAGPNEPLKPGRLPACRKLWVDAAGNVQETNVPC